MKKFTLTCFSFLFVAILFTACSAARNSRQTIPEQAKYEEETLKIDGNNTDWQGPLNFWDDKQAIAYSITNDNEWLYIRALSKNNSTIQRILRGGLTVYINHHGVTEEAGAAGISFPTGNRVKKDGVMLNDKPELQQNIHIALSEVGDYSLFGFPDIKTPENFDYGKPNPLGIELGIGLSASNELVYEAKLPLASVMSKNEWLNPGRKNVAVGLVIETVPGESARRGGGGVSIGGGFGMGSFGSGSGIGISIGSGSLANIGGRKKDKPVKIWKEILLARPVPVK
jgi:hypothetical protein